MNQVDSPPDAPSLRTRTRITTVLFLFALWFLAIVLRLSQYMVFERTDQLAAMERESISEGIIPARRGRLLDRDGVPLAWSVRRFTLTWTVPRQREDALEARRHIAEALQRDPEELLEADDLQEGLGTPVVLDTEVPAAKAAELEHLCADVAGLTVTSRFVRCRNVDPKTAALLGDVSAAGGTEIGVSGAERIHDALLRGHPGSYRVMVDKRGRWLPETWRKTREMRPGYDVYLPMRAPGRTVIHR